VRTGRAGDENSPSRTRTYNKPVNSRLDEGSNPLPASVSDTSTYSHTPNLTPDLREALERAIAEPAGFAGLAALIRAWPTLSERVRGELLAAASAEAKGLSVNRTTTEIA
jgi:hypothetical protein